MRSIHPKYSCVLNQWTCRKEILQQSDQLFLNLCVLCWWLIFMMIRLLVILESTKLTSESYVVTSGTECILRSPSMSEHVSPVNEGNHRLVWLNLILVLRQPPLIHLNEFQSTCLVLFLLPHVGIVTVYVWLISSLDFQWYSQFPTNGLQHWQLRWLRKSSWNLDSLMKILSDRGSNFVSDLFKQILDLFKVRKITTLAYRPQTNGVVERFNHSLVTMVSHFVALDQQD